MCKKTNRLHKFSEKTRKQGNGSSLQHCEPMRQQLIGGEQSVSGLMEHDNDMVPWGERVLIKTEIGDYIRHPSLKNLGIVLSKNHLHVSRVLFEDVFNSNQIRVLVENMSRVSINKYILYISSKFFDGILNLLVAKHPPSEIIRLISSDFHNHKLTTSIGKIIGMTVQNSPFENIVPYLKELCFSKHLNLNFIFCKAVYFSFLNISEHEESRNLLAVQNQVKSDRLNTDVLAEDSSKKNTTINGCITLTDRIFYVNQLFRLMENKPLTQEACNSLCYIPNLDKIPVPGINVYNHLRSSMQKTNQICFLKVISTLAGRETDTFEMLMNFPFSIETIKIFHRIFQALLIQENTPTTDVEMCSIPGIETPEVEKESLADVNIRFQSSVPSLRLTQNSRVMKYFESILENVFNLTNLKNSEVAIIRELCESLYTSKLIDFFGRGVYILTPVFCRLKHICFQEYQEDDFILCLTREIHNGNDLIIRNLSKLVIHLSQDGRQKIVKMSFKGTSTDLNSLYYRALEQVIEFSDQKMYISAVLSQRIPTITHLPVCLRILLKIHQGMQQFDSNIMDALLDAICTDISDYECIREISNILGILIPLDKRFTHKTGKEIYKRLNKFLKAFNTDLTESLISLFVVISRQLGTIEFINFKTIEDGSRCFRTNNCSLFAKIYDSFQNDAVGVFQREWNSNTENRHFILKCLTLSDQIGYSSTIEFIESGILSDDAHIRQVGFDLAIKFLGTANCPKVYLHILNLTWYFVLDKTVDDKFLTLVRMIMKVLDKSIFIRYLLPGLLHHSKRVQIRYRSVLNILTDIHPNYDLLEEIRQLY